MEMQKEKWKGERDPIEIPNKEKLVKIHYRVQIAESKEIHTIAGIERAIII